MAAPYFLSKPFLEENGAVAFSSNYAFYGDMSKRVMETIATILPASCIEVYSVDEAFLDLNHIPLQDLHEVVKKIKDTVELWTGIAVSIGVAPTKTLSKIANNLAKANKAKSNCLLILDTPRKIVAALKRTPVGEIWGIGKQFALKLEKLEVKTAYDLKLMPEEWIRQNLGGVVGVRLLNELKEIPSIVINEQLLSKKMVSCTRRFGGPLNTIQPIKEAVATYTSRAAEKLRRQQSAVKTISVFVIPKYLDRGTIYKPAEPVTTSINLPVATFITNDLIKQAVCLVEKVFIEGETYEKAGVIFSNLVPDNSLQGNFFASQSKPEHRYLMSMIDNINFSMRNEKVKFAAAGVKKLWKMKQELVSPKYTTNWNDLKIIE